MSERKSQVDESDTGYIKREVKHCDGQVISINSNDITDRTSVVAMVPEENLNELLVWVIECTVDYETTVHGYALHNEPQYKVTVHN